MTLDKYDEVKIKGMEGWREGQNGKKEQVGERVCAQGRSLFAGAVTSDADHASLGML